MGKLKKWLRNLSIRKAFMVYTIFFLLVALGLTLFTGLGLNEQKEKIYNGYEQEFLNNHSDGTLVISIYKQPLSEADKQAVEIITGIQTWCAPIYFAACIILAGTLFYRCKLRRPIALLEKASGQIAAHDLDFTIDYPSKDEMGKLCQSFEAMRASLQENNRQLWRSVEERKRLNAAFSHDLRTPLTVLQGYTDLMVKYLPEDKLPKEKLLSTANTMGVHIRRLEDYVSTMSSLQKLEDIQPQVERVSIPLFLNGISTAAGLLCKEKDKALVTHLEATVEEGSLATGLIQQVCENLLANAIRFAKETVTLTLFADDGALTLTVADDGPGFAEELLQTATDPFCHTEEGDEAVHFGIGLYLCKVFCEKLGGTLTLENRAGAVVTANFPMVSFHV